jgi:hypothetical protein
MLSGCYDANYGHWRSVDSGTLDAITDVECIEGQPGKFVGEMSVVYENCGELLPRVDIPIHIEVEEGSYVTECKKHFIDFKNSGFVIEGGWCDELMDTLIEPTEYGYEGTILYELMCEVEKHSCRAKVKVTFVKE